ncbi:sigma-54-dependent transcriptional regulator [Caldisericum exile]|uniref:NtrC family two-component system response regulator n=1 Tax=Caldisericum exile (strain DSM 21853 / NBRC 104410 / AZM16c01) TaxID=511051 RepID=A0A7U6JEY4_CALEA|nr:sigma-54 dependent transcriptional regulator [Caldisericum exile]BAL80928.1 NtrC family two-component system response regulator [Caldisericum exile AZM16c01]
MKIKKYKILVADDEENIRMLLGETLKDESYEVVEVDNGKDAVEQVKTNDFDCVLMDVRMPVLDGMEAFLKIREINNSLPVIFLTAYGSSDLAIKAMKKGAYDYLTKPFDIEELKIKVRKAIELKELTENVPSFEKEENRYASDEIVGNSSKMQEVFKEIGKIAESDATVLIRGESGTGKELVAKAIHHHSTRRNKPFVVVNCAAIPESLLESELFGHEKGAFTDAYTKRIGKFEQANEGTIFLDEIGDMSLNLQAKLLRVLQEKTFNRVGGNETITTTARVLAATNRDLEKLVESGEFREDLFYRLNVVTIWLPPLRERKEDIPLLVDYFVSKYSEKYKKNVRGVSKEVLELFMEYDWPGNVRELENAIARGVIVTSAPLILLEDLPQTLQSKIQKKEENKAQIDEENLNLPQLIEKIEKEAIIKALERAQGNKTKAAQILGISRKSLFNKLRYYNLIKEGEENGKSEDS